MDFDNPLYREMSGLDLPQNPNDIIFLPDSNTVRFLIKLEKFRGYYNNYQMLLQQFVFLGQGYQRLPVVPCAPDLRFLVSKQLPSVQQSSKKSFTFLSLSMFCCLKNKLRKIFGKISVISNLKKLAPKKYKNHRSTRNENSREGLNGERHKFGGRLSSFIHFFICFSFLLRYFCRLHLIRVSKIFPTHSTMGKGL